MFLCLSVSCKPPLIAIGPKLIMPMSLGETPSFKNLSMVKAILISNGFVLSDKVSHLLFIKVSRV